MRNDAKSWNKVENGDEPLDLLDGMGYLMVPYVQRNPLLPGKQLPLVYLITYCIIIAFLLFADLPTQTARSFWPGCRFREEYLDVHYEPEEKRRRKRIGSGDKQWSNHAIITG